MDAEPTVFIVDDDPAVRESLVEVVRTVSLPLKGFSSAQEFLDVYDVSQPGCLVLDLSMPDMSGIELQRKLEKIGSQLPIVFITAHGDIPTSVAAMRAGAVDFLEKPFRSRDLIAAIREALELDTEIRQRSVARQEGQERFANLTPDERQVLSHLVAGKTNKGIAAEMNVSLRTVQFRRASIMRKLNVRSRAELIEMTLSIARSASGYVSDVLVPPAEVSQQPAPLAAPVFSHLHTSRNPEVLA